LPKLRLAGEQEFSPVVTASIYTSVGRELGDAATLIGEPRSARGYYLQALEATTKIRFRPEMVLTHLHLAELMHQEGDDAGAVEHLGIAIPELRDMRMVPVLERGLWLLELVRPTNPAPPTANSPVLTARERAVARLLAGGRSNREIADLLVITEGTVEVHVKHILSKLGFRSRTQIATWFTDQRSERPPDGHT
jgi:DNA-binding CsgD family transcriptional regulator